MNYIHIIVHIEFKTAVYEAENVMMNLAHRVHYKLNTQTHTHTHTHRAGVRYNLHPRNMSTPQVKI